MATTVIYAAIIGLLILLTYLETSLLQPHRSQRQGKRRFRPRQREPGSDPEPPEAVDKS